MKTFLSGVDIQDGQLHVRDISNGAGNFVTVDPTTRQFRERTAVQSLADIGAEPAFLKGSIVQGAGMSITGTLTSRLIGSGDITIAHLDTSSQATVTNTNGSIIQSVTLDAYGHITSLASLDGDARWLRSVDVLNNQSVWSHVTLVGGIDITEYTTGSSGYPTTLGLSVAFYAPTSDSTSGFGRAFALTRGYNTRDYYLGSPNTSGVHNGWDLIYTNNNLNLSTLGGTPTSRTLTFTTNNGITGGSAAVDLSTNRAWTFGLTGQALALHNLATNGLIARTGNGTVAGRTITGTTNQISVTNGNGVSGNPTISLPSTINVNTTGSAATLTTARTLTIGSTGKTFNGSANISWSLAEIGAAATSHTHPASQITTGTFGAGDYVFPNQLTVTGRIVDVKAQNNIFYNNLGAPMIEEYALIQGQMNNKFRFLSPTLQEESTDGVTWTTSTRATVGQLGDMMRGEGQGTSVNVIPAPALGGTGFYRLTWNASQTGYISLNKLYIYCSTNGNQVEFTIQRKHNTTGWETLTSGTLSNWPGHVYCAHSAIWFNPTNPVQFGEVRISFRIVSATQTNPFTLFNIEWLGSYPAATRNAESYDRDRNVTFPAAITGTRLISTVATGTAPLTVTSTTRVTNLNVATAGTADTWTTARTLTIGSTGKSVNGSANVSWSLAEIGAEPSFTKGSLIAGTNVLLSGTLTNRLIGTGDVTINVNGQVPVRQVFTYASSNTFTLSQSNPTAIYVALNGQVLEQGALYDWTISGTTLTITTPLLSGDEISILYYTNLPTVTNYGRNIDGGAPNSVYLPIQNVDGGTP
jgi:hypothetical protein